MVNPDDEDLLNLASGGLSTASIANIMGSAWSEARVYNRLAALKGQASPPPPPPRQDVPQRILEVRTSAPRPAPPPQILIPARKLRYIGWFMEAGWRAATVAQLFDVDVSDLPERWRA